MKRRLPEIECIKCIIFCSYCEIAIVPGLRDLFVPKVHSSFKVDNFGNQRRRRGIHRSKLTDASIQVREFDYQPRQCDGWLISWIYRFCASFEPGQDVRRAMLFFM